jgi:hypothetical protein
MNWQILEVMMIEEDNKVLDSFLLTIEEMVDYIPIDIRVAVINDIKKEIKDSAEAKSVSINEVLKTYGSTLELINRHLKQRNLPKAKNKKKRNIIKIVLLSMFIITLVLVLSVLLLLKSFTPIFEFSENDGTITFFGDRLVFEPDDGSFFNHTRLRDQKDLIRQVKHTGKLETIGISKIKFYGENSDLAFRVHEFTSVDYKCESDTQPKDMVEKVNEEYILKLPNASQCMFNVPIDITLEGEFKKGFINLRNIKQDVFFDIKAGHISWKQEEQKLFSVKIDGSRNKIDGDLNGFEDNGLYRAEFKLGEGSINIRK